MGNNPAPKVTALAGTASKAAVRLCLSALLWDPKTSLSYMGPNAHFYEDRDILGMC